MLWIDILTLIVTYLLVCVVFEGVRQEMNPLSSWNLAFKILFFPVMIYHWAYDLFLREDKA